MKYLTGIVLLLILVNENFGDSSDNCVKEKLWSKYKDSYYYFGSRSCERMSYYDAKEYCQTMGANLVSIHSEVENKFILNKMDGGRAWIGLNILSGQQEWSDGSNVTYLNIVKKEFPKKEKCFMMYKIQGGWRPEHCALHYLPICKYTPDASLPPPKVIPKKPGYCPSGWLQFGQKCYMYFGIDEKARLKYNEARNACWNLGEEFSLVSIHSMEEQAFLTQHLADLGTSTWIGINKVESDEMGHDIVFGWVDNSINNFTYWAVGHPPRGTWKYCGRLAFEGMNKGEWIADYCDVKKRGYICQRSTDPNLPQPTPKPSKCKAGFNGYRNSCYRYMSVPQTQEKAEKTCQTLGGHLLSITDAFEQAFLYNLLVNYSQPIGIGLENVQGTRYLRWTDKQPLYFTNFADTEPRFTTRNESRCTFMDHTNNFKWNMTDCNRQIGYVCKTTTDAASEPPMFLGTCPSGNENMIDIGDKYCYHLSVDRSHRILSWDSTSRYCISKGMKMVSLHSDHEMKSLVAHLWRENYPVHLGLIRTFDKKSFMWVDGSRFNYTNWEDREPWQNDKNCVAFSPINGKWSVINCSEAGVALCRLNKK